MTEKTTNSAAAALDQLEREAAFYGGTDEVRNNAEAVRDALADRITSAEAHLILGWMGGPTYGDAAGRALVARISKIADRDPSA